ncbi:MAG TPA: histidinol dehydrogenase, partial [Thermotogota bacterium]|nr:histidinol dehydrogenase [Thermotogota bacterium]
MELRKYVSGILEELREKGEDALTDCMRRFDGYTGEMVPDSQEWAESEAVEEVDRNIFERVIERLLDYHQHQEKRGFAYLKNGSLFGLKEVPLSRIGIYIPGGMPLPSTLMMTAVPARIAGVEEIALCTPPVQGRIPTPILYLAKRFGIKEVYKIGGIQAIAAMAYGIGMKRVDKIFGPGNAYVNEAKRQVYGDVGIDSPAGPSEICVIADENANKEFVLNDLMSQREHGKDSKAWLLTPSTELAAFCDNGQIEISVLDSLEDCVRKANEIAPEHLQISVNNPLKYLDSVINAGAIYFGEYTPVPSADYFLGTNHVLPTGG